MPQNNRHTANARAQQKKHPAGFYSPKNNRQQKRVSRMPGEKKIIARTDGKQYLLHVVRAVYVLVVFGRLRRQMRHNHKKRPQEKKYRTRLQSKWNIFRFV